MSAQVCRVFRYNECFNLAGGNRHRLEGFNIGILFNSTLYKTAVCRVRTAIKLLDKE